MIAGAEYQPILFFLTRGLRTDGAYFGLLHLGLLPDRRTVELFGKARHVAAQSNARRGLDGDWPLEALPEEQSGTGHREDGVASPFAMNNQSNCNRLRHLLVAAESVGQPHLLRRPAFRLKLRRICHKDANTACA